VKIIPTAQVEIYSIFLIRGFVKRKMKTYFKIFAVTIAVQIIGFVLAYVTDEFLRIQNVSTVLPVAFLLSGVLISTILGIILPVVFGKTLKQKLLTIFLLPTNYVWLLIIFMVIYFYHHIVEILTHIPANFG